MLRSRRQLLCPASIRDCVRHDRRSRGDCCGAPEREPPDPDAPLKNERIESSFRGAWLSAPQRSHPGPLPAGPRRASPRTVDSDSHASSSFTPPAGTAREALRNARRCSGAVSRTSCSRGARDVDGPRGIQGRGDRGRASSGATSDVLLASNVLIAARPRAISTFAVAATRAGPQTLQSPTLHDRRNPRPSTSAAVPGDDGIRCLAARYGRRDRVGRVAARPPASTVTHAAMAPPHAHAHVSRYGRGHGGCAFRDGRGIEGWQPIRTT